MNFGKLKSSQVYDYRTEHLINTNKPETGLAGKAKFLISEGLKKTFGVIHAGENPPIPDPIEFRPYHDSNVYGMTHIGIMISDLPAPHYFLSCASLIGACGFRIFDVDHAVSKDGPRHTATLAHASAVSTENGFMSYSMLDEMDFKADGSYLRFGSDVEISGTYPNYHLKSQRENFAVDLTLKATGEITWFCKSALYNHLSLMTRYTGTITSDGVVMPVSGLCTYEYARGVSPYVIRNQFVPQPFKLPIDTFSYQVINLDADTQLLFVHLGFMHYPGLTSAYLRTAGKKDDTRIDAVVNLEVLSLQDQPVVAPDGSTMPIAKDFRWTIISHSGVSLFEINATIDTPMVFGLGTGFIGGYKWHGTRGGQAIEGRGYIEYVDQRQ